MKLTNSQKKKIIALHADGVSQSEKIEVFAFGNISRPNDAFGNPQIT